MKLKPQDIVIVLKIIALGVNKSWRISDISYETGISASEISEGLERLKFAQLIDETKKKPLKKNLLEFLVYGLKYVYPAVLGTVERGIPTAHSSGVLNEIVSEEVYVWEHPAGKSRGLSIIPLYKTVPDAVLRDDIFYQLLSLVEILRVGKVREKTLAEKKLKEIL